MTSEGLMQTIPSSFGLHSNGMHEWIITEFELGQRVAHCQDCEIAGWSALMDLSYTQWVLEDKQRSNND